MSVWGTMLSPQSPFHHNGGGVSYYTCSLPRVFMDCVNDCRMQAAVSHRVSPLRGRHFFFFKPQFKIKLWIYWEAAVRVFWMLTFKPTFSLSSFTFIKKFFSSSSLSAFKVVSSAYLRLLIFLLAILIPAWASSSQAFYMMHSEYKLNKQDDNIQPWCTPFAIWNQSVVPCPVLTVVSWHAYRFLKRQVRYSKLLKNFPQVIVIYANAFWLSQ